jgi:adenylosuccinate lyase
VLLNELNAISPIDGRYRKQTTPLAAFFSEFALIRYRIRVEVEYFIALCQIPLPQLTAFPKEHFQTLRKLYLDFGEEDAEFIKMKERETNHDVKAMEYFIKTRMQHAGLGNYLEFIHFGLTSQDVNNTAIPLSLKCGLNEVLLPQFDNLLHILEQLSSKWSHIPMLARTHGQAASPTRLGKEIQVFAERLEKQLSTLSLIPFAAKFGGATGNFNAHHVAYPQVDWTSFANDFVDNTLGLKRSQHTTQIEHYDFLAALLDNLKRINTVLIDLSRDLWQYIAMDYFKLTIKAGEVGSSAMPHKVNPIDFENAEGNLGMADALFEHLSAKLPISRLQRDLTDSTVLRNLGVTLAHTLIACLSLKKGLEKLEVNSPALEADLEKNWAVVAEGIQTILRREGYPKPYEALRDLTRTHDGITQQSLHAFIDTLEVSEPVKTELKSLSPFTYTGI